MTGFLMGVAVGLLAAWVWNLTNSRHGIVAKEIGESSSHILTRTNRIIMLLQNSDDKPFPQWKDEFNEAVVELGKDVTAMGKKIGQFYS